LELLEITGIRRRSGPVKAPSRFYRCYASIIGKVFRKKQEKSLDNFIQAKNNKREI